MNIDDEFSEICRQIVSESLSKSEWGKIESDDMFQTEKYVGGYDADEQAFCFSLYRDNVEYWFQVTLDEAEQIARGSLSYVEIREAEL